MGAQRRRCFALPACRVLFLLACVVAARDEEVVEPARAKGPPPPLDPNPDLARSGCEAVLTTLRIMFSNPPAEFRQRTARASPDAPLVPYTSTEAFVDDSMRVLCNSQALAQYRIVDGLLGAREWVEDPVPDYSPVPAPVPASLGKTCRRMLKRHRRMMVSTILNGTPVEDACAKVVGAAPTDLWGRAVIVMRRLRANPAALFRLTPLIIVAAALPFVIAPVFKGMPPVLEPRGPREPGDDDGGDGDDAQVGCVPPVLAPPKASAPGGGDKKAAAKRKKT